MKSFDIYLRDRLTECDILISSLTLYDDGWSADSRMILESCLEKYLLYKVIAVQTGSELVSHIDEMIKTCYEKLRLKTHIGASAEFTENVWPHTDGSAMVLGAKKVKLKACTYEQFVDQVEMAVEQLSPLVTKYLYTEAVLPIGANVDEMVKTGYIAPEAGVVVSARVADSKQVFDTALSEMELDADMKDLLYRVYCAGEHVMQVAATVAQTNAVKRLDANAEMEVSADVEIAGEKYAEAEVQMLMLIDITGILMKLIRPDESALVLDATASSMLRRKRKLTEIDGYDPMPGGTDTLGSLDFIVLEE